MGKKATDRIKRITTKLMMEGKLDKPYYPAGQRNTVQSKVADNRQRCRSCKRYKGFEGFNEAGLCPSCVSVQSSDCCVGSLSRLPDGVVSCPDCPLD
jgi:hypothetical protein